MFLLLEDVRGSGRTVEHTLALPDLLDEQDRPLLVRPARLRGRVDPGRLGVDLRARLEAELRLCCSRCLEFFEEPLAVPVELTLVGDAVEFGDAETMLDPADAELFYAEGGRVDFGRIAREQIELHLPLKPVCSAGCRGLCQSCGADRNRIQCGCPAADFDLKLAPLLRFKSGNGERS